MGNVSSTTLGVFIMGVVILVFDLACLVAMFFCLYDKQLPVFTFISKILNAGSLLLSLILLVTISIVLSKVYDID